MRWRARYAAATRTGRQESPLWPSSTTGLCTFSWRNQPGTQVTPPPPPPLRIVAARLNGSLDFFTVEINKPACLLQFRGETSPESPPASPPPEPQHQAACCLCSGAPGRGSVPPSPCYSSEDVISCQLTRSVLCAHQKPITVLRAAAGRVVTGSQDHTVRVRGSSWGGAGRGRTGHFLLPSCSLLADLPPGGFLLSLHAAGSLCRDHSHLHRPGQLPVSQ